MIKPADEVVVCLPQVCSRLCSGTTIVDYDLAGNNGSWRVYAADAVATVWQYAQDGRELWNVDARRQQNRINIYLGNIVLATRAMDWGAITVRYLRTDALGGPVAETDATGALHAPAPGKFRPFGLGRDREPIDLNGRVTSETGCHLTTKPPPLKCIAWARTSMARKKHPKPEVEAAIQHAEQHGWAIREGGSHAWGRMLCPYNDATCRCGEFCATSIWSTPRNAGNHGKQLRRVVDNCARERAKQQAVDKESDDD